MPRSSRHKSHKQHKHSSRDARERSESEDEGTSRETRSREEAVESAPRDRVSRDPEAEKRKSSPSLLPSHGKDISVPSNGDFSADHGKKRKDRTVGSASAADRWDGGDMDERLDGKELDSEKMMKAKILVVDSRGKSSRRCEGPIERKEESVGKDNSAKRRPEKESGQRDTSVQYRDVNGARERESEREQGSERDRDHVSDRERDRGSDRGRERGSDRDRGRGPEKERMHSSDRVKKLHDTRCERSDDAVSGKEGNLIAAADEERKVRRDVENTDRQVQDDLYSPGLERQLEKQTRKRRDSLGDKDKWQEDGTDVGDSKTYFKDGLTKDSGYRDEKYRDKYWEDVDRAKRWREDKHREDHSSRDHTSNRSDIKHYNDEDKPSENRCKKSKHQDSDLDGSPYTEDCDNKYKDNRGRKRSSDVVKNVSPVCKVDSKSGRGKTENSEKLDSTLCTNRQKSSPSSSSQSVKDQYRHSSKQLDTTSRNSLEEMHHPTTASSGDLTSVTIDHGRIVEAQPLERSKLEDLHSDELLVEIVASSQCERIPRSGGCHSPIQLDRRQLNRMVTRCSIDVEEMGQRSSSLNDVRDLPSKDDKEEFFVEKPAVHDHSQAELLSSDLVSTGSPSSDRIDHFPSGSSSHLPPPPPVRFGIESPSVLGSFDEDNRFQAGDRKSSSHYKRNGDYNVGRGQGNAWKGMPSWPSQLANGFIPFQHGPPPAGFHPAFQQFSSPSLFVRPSMDLSHTGVPYQLREAPDRFPTHARPFGWRNPSDETLPPHMQGWDGNNGIFGDESLVFGRHDWEPNRRLIGSRWEMSAEMWKGQNRSLNMEFQAPQKEADYSTCISADETWVGQFNNRQSSEQSRSERLRAESDEIKRLNETPTKNVTEASSRIICKKSPELSKQSNDGAFFCGTYLSKIDISADLARPELYNQCICLIGLGDVRRDSKVTKGLYHQNIGEDIEVAVKSSSHLLSPPFPAITEAIFQRAMSLYKKQSEGMGIKFPSLSVQAKEEKDSPINPCAEEVEKVENLIRQETPQANINNMDEFPSSAVESKSDIIPKSVFVEGSSMACEVIMPECRVDLSRIHHSSESTR